MPRFRSLLAGGRPRVRHLRRRLWARHVGSPGRVVGVGRIGHDARRQQPRPRPGGRAAPGRRRRGMCASAGHARPLPEGWTLVRAQRQHEPLTRGDGDVDDLRAHVLRRHGRAGRLLLQARSTPPAALARAASLRASRAPRPRSRARTSDAAPAAAMRGHPAPGTAPTATARSALVGPRVRDEDSNGSCSARRAPPKVTKAGDVQKPRGRRHPRRPPFAGTIVVCPRVDERRPVAVPPAGAASPFREQPPSGAVCVTRPDDTPCPAGWTNDVIPAFEGADDSRTCAACACDVECQGGSYTVWGGATSATGTASRSTPRAASKPRTSSTSNSRPPSSPTSATAALVCAATRRPPRGSWRPGRGCTRSAAGSQRLPHPTESGSDRRGAARIPH